MKVAGLSRQTRRPNFLGQRITVFGLSRSGTAAAAMLSQLGAAVLCTDIRPIDQLRSAIDDLADTSMSAQYPIDYVLGQHNYRCIEKADLIVVSPGVPVDQVPILSEAKQQRIPIVSELEVASSVCLAPIIAITGTKGKTTTTLLTGEILKQGNFRRVCVVGNIGEPFSNSVLDLTAEDIVVAEVSSFQLEATVSFHPTISAILNLSPDHLDRHRTLEAYQQAKQKIYANQTADDWIVLNADDPYTASLTDLNQAETCVRPAFFSQTIVDKTMVYRQNGQIYAPNYAAKQPSDVGSRKQSYVCDREPISLAGNHNLDNILSAVAIGQICRIPVLKIRQALYNFKATDHASLRHAFESVQQINGIDFIDDSKATNVAATQAALRSISTTGRRILLIMGGYDKGNDYTPLIGLIKSRVKVLILLGQQTQTIRNALSDYVVTLNTPTMELAVEQAFQTAVSGDTVLLSPANASYDMFIDYKDRGSSFQQAIAKLDKQTCSSEKH